MKLVRFATIETPSEPKPWASNGISFGEVHVGCLLEKQLEGGRHKKVVFAGTTLEHSPKLSADGRVILDVRIREGLEEAIEHYANLLALANSMSRQVASTMPCVGLKAETADEEGFLSKAAGFAQAPGPLAAPGSIYRIDVEAKIAYLQDRLDGVAIIAEMLSHDRASARFRDIIRIFERAFALGGQRLKAPLYNFLRTSFGHHTLEEVGQWITVRDGVTHADRQTKPLFDADVAWVVERATQAACDVLLNKADWRTSTTDRRSVWQPTCYTSSPDGTSLHASQDAEMFFIFRTFDEFKRFPPDGQGAFTGVPVGWWTGQQQVYQS